MAERSILDHAGLADLRAVLLGLHELGQTGEDVIRRAGKRTAADRQFLYLRDNAEPDRGYRKSSPCNAFIEGFLDVLATSIDEIKTKLPESLHQHVDRLLQFHANRKASFSNLSSFGLSIFELLPLAYRDRIEVFRKDALSDMGLIFSGYKIVYRVAFEDTGRIAREVIRFQADDQFLTFRWWFQTDGGDGPRFRRENMGVVVPLRTSYLMIGFHDGGRKRELRFRSAVIERQIPPLQTIAGVQIGIATSTNAQKSFPAATKFLWVSIPANDIEEDELLDRTVGFFGEPGWHGLNSLKESFEGSMIAEDAIALIWSCIDNQTEGARLLATPQDADWGRLVVPLLLRQNWGQIIQTYKDGARLDEQLPNPGVRPK